MNAQERLNILLNGKAELETGIKSQQLSLKVIEQDIRDTKEILELEKKKRDTFPPGFRFGYNSRRGDPQYTPYWYCELRDVTGKELWSQHYSENNYTEPKAKLEALKSAWSLVDIANGIASFGKRLNETHD